MYRRDFLALASVASDHLLTHRPFRALQQPKCPDDRILAIMRQERIPGLATNIILNGQVVWSKGYGYVDLTSGSTA